MKYRLHSGYILWKGMRLQYRDNSVTLAGYYDEEEDVIYIAAGLPPLIAECTYLHEAQHQKCYKAGCKCYRAENNDLAEYHAYKGELMAVLERDSAALAKAYLKGMDISLEKAAKDPVVWRSHKRAMVRVMRLTAYCQVQRLARECHTYPGEKNE